MLKNCLQYILSVLKDVEGVLGFPGDTVVKNPPTMQETQKTQVVIPGLGNPLGKEMATHSSILIWKIPWTEEPRRLQSMESQRVIHD